MGMSSVVKKAFLIRERNIPHRLRHYPHWLMWRYERADGDKPGAKLRKVPYYPSGHKRAGVIGGDRDVERLGTFREAIEAAKIRGFDGVGLAILPQQDITVIDLDDCISDTGVYSDFANELIEHGSYVERSPSGRGLRAVYDGALVEDQKCNFRINNGERVEVYCGKAYTTFTGNKLPSIELDDIRPLPKDIKRRLLAGIGDRGTSESSVGDGGGLASMNAIALPNMTLGQAAKVLAGLPEKWGKSGEGTWYQVMAAVQLQFGKTEEAYEMVDAWLQTRSGYDAVGNRDRWDKGFAHEHGKQTVTSMKNLVFETIDEAKKKNKKQIKQETLESWGLGRSVKKAKPLDDDDLGEEEAQPLPLVDISGWDTQEEPPGTTALVRDMFYEGTNALITAHGGSGKSYIFLMFCIFACAGGHTWFGEKITQGNCLYISGEDPIEEVRLRVWRTCRAYGIDLKNDVAGKLDISDMTRVLRKAFYTGSDYGKAEFTEQYDSLVKSVSSGKYKYMVLDNLTKFFMGNENSRAMVDEFLSALTLLAVDHNMVFILLGHDAKLSTKSSDPDIAAEAYSGSSGWHNGVRSRISIEKKKDEKYNRYMTVRKNNYGMSGHGGRLEFDRETKVFMLREAIGEGSAVSEFAQISQDDLLCEAVARVIREGSHVPAESKGRLGRIGEDPELLPLGLNTPIKIRAALQKLATEKPPRLVIREYEDSNSRTKREYVPVKKEKKGPEDPDFDPING